MAKIYQFSDYQSLKNNKSNENQNSDNCYTIEYDKKINKNLMNDYLEFIKFIENFNFDYTVEDAIDILTNRAKLSNKYPEEIDEAIQVALKELPFRLGKNVSGTIINDNEISLICPNCNTTSIIQKSQNHVYCYNCGMKLINKN